MTPDERRTAGKRLRDTVPRDAHNVWRAHAGRESPVEILRAADATRQAHSCRCDTAGCCNRHLRFIVDPRRSWPPTWRGRRRRACASRRAATRT